MRIEEISPQGIVDLGSPPVEHGKKSFSDSVFLFTGARIYDRQLPGHNWVKTGIMTELMEETLYLTLQVPWEIRKDSVEQLSSIDTVVGPLLSGLAETTSKHMNPLNFHVIVGYLLPNPNLAKVPYFFSQNQPSFYCMVYANAKNNEAPIGKPHSVRLATVISLGDSDFVRETSRVCERLMEGCSSAIQKDYPNGIFRSEHLLRQVFLQGLLPYIKEHMVPTAVSGNR